MIEDISIFSKKSDYETKLGLYRILGGFKKEGESSDEPDWFSILLGDFTERYGFKG